MRVLTAQGDFAPVPLAADFLGGLDPSSGIPLRQGFRSHRLVDGPGGSIRTARFAEIYKSNPWIWGAVQIKATGLSRFPLHVFEFDAGGERRRVRSDLPGTPGRPTGPEQLDRILRRPQPGWSRRKLLKRVMVDFGVYHDGLLEKLREGGVIVGLRHHQWGRVSPKISKDGTEVLYFELPDKRRLFPEDVVHLSADDDPDSPLGVSPISSLKWTNALYDAVGRYLMAYFKNQAAPSGHVELPPGSKRDTAKVVRQMISDFYAAPENAGKVLATLGKWTQVGATPDHSQVIELVRLSREEAATAYRIPPPVMGILDRAIKSNVKELGHQYVRDVLGPDAEMIETELESQLLPDMPSWRHTFVEFQMAELLRPDPVSEAAMLTNSGWMTIDEKRRTKNMSPLNIAGVTDVPTLLLDPGSKPLDAGAEVDADDDPDDF